MVDDGLEFIVDENFLPTKMNRKTKVVGNSTQLTNLSTTYGGQLVYPLTTGGSFTIDKLYARDTANTVWNEVVREAAQVETILNSDTTNFSVGAPPKIAWEYYTLPTTKKLYTITFIEWKNGTTVAGNILCGAATVDANPPVNTQTEIMALGEEVAATGANTLQRVSRIACKPIRGGATIGFFFICSANTDFKTSTSSSINNIQTPSSYSATPPAALKTGWNTGTFRLFLTIGLRGY